jgi:hypothetical protein
MSAWDGPMASNDIAAQIAMPCSVFVDFILTLPCLS